ncbi:MAG: glyoxylase-like metal-dependent hydrolase (beta-lactamase superfamily II) [Paracoccaceae bacterium]|jgi:glyoxylase-like metal-dependent hydrolase (beta-lactamase superfamily II)
MTRIAAADWWRVTSIDEGVSLIDEPHIKPFYRCNCWHIRGADQDLLIDSGMGVVSLRDWVPLVTERPLLAVASHTHFDHIGCHHEFEQRAVHRAEAHLLAAPTRTATLADPYVTDEIFEALPPAPYRSVSYEVTPAPATRLLEDGCVIDTGDRRFEVVHTPGHSPGGIALWEAKTGLLFSGDIIYDGPLIEDTYHADADDYVRSMKRLLDLPVRVVHGGHFPSFSGEKLGVMITDWLRAHDI